jgi:hypothetical protein
MQFLKKHYEKIVLSAVLLGLAAAAFWLSSAVEEARQQAAPATTQPPAKTPWPTNDLSKEQAALANLHNPPALELSGDHNLFNPVTWKRMPNGDLKKVLHQGPSVLQVTEITPLYYYIKLDSRVGDGYRLNAVPPPPARPTNWFAKLGDKEDKRYPCTIVGTNAAADGSPTLQVHIIATGETNSMSSSNPYRRVDSYEADLKYTPDAISFAKKRVGSILNLSEEPYKIIAITNNAVTVQSAKTTQRTTIEWISAH